MNIKNDFVIYDLIWIYYFAFFTALIKNILILFLFPATAQFKPPVFKIVNSASGQFLTAAGPDEPITLEDSFSDAKDEQKW